MQSLSGFLEMGGYAAFVWPAYALTAIVLVALAVSSLLNLRARRSALDALRSGHLPMERGSEDPQ